MLLAVAALVIATISVVLVAINFARLSRHLRRQARTYDELSALVDALADHIEARI